MAMGGQTSRSGSRLNGHDVDFGIAPRGRMERYEVELVNQQRARYRASWQACAANVGRSVHDVRKACDPTYRPEVDFGQPTPPPPKRRMLLQPGSPHARALVGLSLALKRVSGRTTAPAASVVLVVSGMSVNSIGMLLGRLQTIGLVVAAATNHEGQCMWSLTPMGHAEAAAQEAAGG
jgi:hypothetical protein